MNIQKVIKRMGAKWVLHKDNHVKRLAHPLSDSVGTDVAATFKRVRERMAADSSANAAEVSRKVTNLPKGRKNV